MEPIAKFWMVLREGGNHPTFRHYTKEAARQEATRLADQNPGYLFYVLAVVDARKTAIGPVEPVSLRRATEAEILDSEIPF